MSAIEDSSPINMRVCPPNPIRAKTAKGMLTKNATVTPSANIPLLIPNWSAEALPANDAEKNELVRAAV